MRTFMLVAVLALSGCTSTVYKDRIVEVPYVVFSTPPKAADVDQMDLPIFEITKDSSREDVAKAFVASVEILLAERKQSRAALEPFRKGHETDER